MGIFGGRKAQWTPPTTSKALHSLESDGARNGVGGATQSITLMANKLIGIDATPSLAIVFITQCVMPINIVSYCFVSAGIVFR